MRWPIHIQLLLPMLAVVSLAVVAASVAGAYLGALRTQRAQEENLRRVVHSVANARYPITQHVLEQMRGLSGAEFVFLTPDDTVEAGTIACRAEELQPLRGVARAPGAQLFADATAVQLGGEAFLGDRVPVTGPWRKPPAGTLVVLYPTARRWEVIRQAVTPALWAGAVAAAAAMFLTAGLSRRFVRPIQVLVRQTAAIVHGRFHPLPVARRNDEIRDLTLAINHMASRLVRYEAEVRRSERMRTLGQLGAGMAHQLRNAATGARMGIEFHQRDCHGPADDESLGVALAQLQLMESYLQRFLTLGRPEAANLTEVDLGRVVREALALVQPACRHAGIAVCVAGDEPPLRIRGNAPALQQLVINLVLNAIEALGPAGNGTPGEPAAAGRNVRIQIEHDTTSARLHVLDSGPGPDPRIAAQLFEPFVTQKPDGTGLGLFVARQIAEAHQGHIQWDRHDGMTRFMIELPREDNASHAVKDGGSANR